MSDQKHVQSLQLFPLYTRVVTEKDTVFGVFCEHLEKSGVTLMDGDVVLVTSKIVSLAEDGVSVDTDLKPSEAASSLAKEYQTSKTLYHAFLFVTTTTTTTTTTTITTIITTTTTTTTTTLCSTGRCRRRGTARPSSRTRTRCSGACRTSSPRSTTAS